MLHAKVSYLRPYRQPRSTILNSAKTRCSFPAVLHGLSGAATGITRRTARPCSRLRISAVAVYCTRVCACGAQLAATSERSYLKSCAVSVHKRYLRDFRSGRQPPWGWGPLTLAYFWRVTILQEYLAQGIDRSAEWGASLRWGVYCSWDRSKTELNPLTNYWKCTIRRNA